MKILHIVRRLDASWGGAPAAAAHMAAALASEGHAVTVATTVATASSYGETDQLASTLKGVRVERFPRTGLPYDHSAKLSRWVSRVVTDYELVEVHGVFDHPCWRSAEMARHKRRPYIVHPHGSLDPFDLRKHERLKQILGPKVVRRLLEKSAAVMVTTDREGHKLNCFGATPRVQSIALPYRHAATVGDGDRFRNVFDLGHARILLFLGRVDYKKGLAYLVDAADNLTAGPDRTVVVIAGDRSTPYGQTLSALIAKRGLDRAVRMVGHLAETEKADALSAASALALVSDNENYGLVLVEAARAGVPMLVSDQVYLQPELTKRGCALVVPRDGRAIAQAVERLFADSARLAEMSVAARRTAEDLFDWQAVAKAHSTYRGDIIDMTCARWSN